MVKKMRLSMDSLVKHKLLICAKHFDKNDFSTANFQRLKPGIVPHLSLELENPPLGIMACNPNDCCLCCTPCTFPFAQVTMVLPPPILAPTAPQPVRPLQLYCPPDETPLLSQEEREKSRYDNFYNNYNIDWHSESPRYRKRGPQPQCTKEKQYGQTVDGKLPCCNEKPSSCDDDSDPGCPTGFKPCTMKLTPPPGCDPCGVWCAQIQPCPPKPRKSNQFQPGDCCKSKCKQ